MIASPLAGYQEQQRSKNQTEAEIIIGRNDDTDGGGKEEPL